MNEVAGRLSTADRVYGTIGAAAVLLALFFLVRGGARDGDGAAAAPTLAILAPATGTEHPQPLAVRFDAGTEVTGSGLDPAAGRHVHARVDASELMPGPADVQPLGGTRYRWTLPRLPAGTHTVTLYWADAAHRPLAEGASAPVVVRVE